MRGAPPFPFFSELIEVGAWDVLLNLVEGIIYQDRLQVYTALRSAHRALSSQPGEPIRSIKRGMVEALMMALFSG